MFGDGCTVGCSLHEYETEVLLQGLDRPRHGWLRHPQSRSCAAEVAFLGDGDKILEMANKIHRPIETRPPAAIPKRNDDAMPRDLARRQEGVIA
ncbi:hypothetical protein CH274_23380 [Rhodococcus sp. 06-418-5]|nr:hypothetical protein CH274_23380 [Rhodococcus sp. 06-418-5]